ncbi:MAG: VWA domain-containing protein [Anaerolineae bacterium]|nr:VWA domain-containing protein [Anaerolineae bacterium]MCX8067351.1 VWA domain-containing protein [Anaerolineae bacterium]MDW7990875.1 VWA domain-containing protein [Anaerolineae bacterium]
MAGEVMLSVQTNRPAFPTTGSAQLAYVLIEARPVGAIAQVRMPLNFAFVLDHSGSMAGAKLSNLKAAAKLAIDRLGPDDLVSVVIFDDKVQVLVPSRPADHPSALKREIENIRDGGGTEMSKGMRAGLDELRKGLSPGRVSRMLLLTDGETFGDADICRKLAAEAGRSGIPIIALGLGEDWNEELLDDIAEASRGVSDFIPDRQPEAILKSFEEHVRTAQATAVQNAHLILRLVPGVLPRAVWRVTPLIAKLGHRALSDRDVQVTLGDMDVKQGQSVLVEMLLPPRAPGAYRIAQAEITYDIIALGRVGEKEKVDVVVEFTPDLARASQVNPYVMNIVEKVTAHRLQTQALDEAAAGNIAGATQKLRAAATRLLELGEEELARTALEEARRLEEGKGLSPAGTKKLRYETRKLTQKLD